jgi:cell division protein FtsW
MRISRAERSVLGDWWYSLDAALLVAFVALMVAGVVASLAASPAVALRLHLDTFHFVKRQALLMLPAMVLFVGASLVPVRRMPAVGAVMLGLALLLLLATPFVGAYAKGARRWIDIAGFSLQASEFVKPAMVLVCAYLFAEARERADDRALWLAVGLYVMALGLLVIQPDYGQSVLLTLVWGAMFFLAGMPWPWVGGLAAFSLSGLGLAYLFVPHVRLRIGHYFDPTVGDNYQVGYALRSFTEGGWFGRGLGEGVIKQRLPDAHADYVFAVIGEEFGVIACLLLLALYAFIVLRGLSHAQATGQMFRRLALAGMMLLLGFQAAINMGVNLAILPAKGMTLPFISYGGSSLVALALAMGLALGLARRQRGEARFAHTLPLFRKGV